MERMTELELFGRTYHLNYSMAVMFEVEEKYKEVTKLLEEMSLPGAKGFEATRWIFVQMATSGEIVRRYEGYDPEPIPELKELGRNAIRPWEYTALKNACMEAITAGYKQESQKKEEEIDEGLAEIQRKKDGAEDEPNAIM